MACPSAHFRRLCAHFCVVAGIWLSVLSAAAQEAPAPVAPPQTAPASPEAAPSASRQGFAPDATLAPTPAAATLTTRSGLSVRFDPLPQNAAVVQLWVRLPPTLSLADRTFLTPYAFALAEGRLSSTRPSLADATAALGGRTAVHIDADRLVVSLTVPARQTANALAFVDARLAGRGRLLPVSPDNTRVRILDPAPSLRRPFDVEAGGAGEAASPAPQVASDDVVPAEILQLWAPNHPYRAPLYPPAGQAPTAADLARLSDQLLRRGQVELVVAAPEETKRLAVLLDRQVRTVLPRTTVAPTPPLAPLVGRHELDLKSAPKTPKSVILYVPLPPAASAKEFAVRCLVATHLNATVFEREAGALFVVDQSQVQPHNVEEALKETASLSASAFERARALAITAVSARGQALETRVYLGALTSTEAKLEALAALTQDDLGTFFASIEDAPRILETRTAP